MPNSHVKKDAVTAISQTYGNTTAEIVSHPRRLSGLMAKKQALESALAAQKQAAVIKIEHAISCVTAMRTRDSDLQVDLMVKALRLVLKEVQVLDPQHARTADVFIGLANQLQELSVNFTSAMSAELCQSKSA